MNIYGTIRRSPAIFKPILSMANTHFSQHISTAKNLNVSIYMNRTPIYDARTLAVKIANRRLENDRRTLDLFLKAIKVTNSEAYDAMDKPFTFKLELGKLLRGELSKNNLQNSANIFLAIGEYKEAFRVLREMGAVKPE